LFIESPGPVRVIVNVGRWTLQPSGSARNRVGQVPAGHAVAERAPDLGQRTLVERYVRAWESSDVESLVALLKEDATVSMPPWRQWYRGHEGAAAFLCCLSLMDAMGALDDRRRCLTSCEYEYEYEYVSSAEPG
jgi:hypothetical protein